jgi:hypothetical protein
MGNMFIQAAAEANVSNSNDFFDGSMIQIPKDDFAKFIEKLIEMEL